MARQPDDTGAWMASVDKRLRDMLTRVASITGGSGGGSGPYDAGDITTGTLDVARLPSIPASQTGSGTFATARIPNLPAAQITSGTLDVARLPSLPASQITSGVLDPARQALSNQFGPEDSGFVAWSHDPAACSSVAAGPATQRAYFAGIVLRSATTLNRVHLFKTNDTAPVLTGAYVGLYDSAGNRVAVSANSTGSFTTGGQLQTVSLTGAYSAAAGYYWAAVLLVGTTIPTLAMGSSASVNGPTAGGGAAYGSGFKRYNRLSATNTTLPTSFNTTSGVSNDANAFWMAVS